MNNFGPFCYWQYSTSLVLKTLSISKQIGSRGWREKWSPQPPPPAQPSKLLQSIIVWAHRYFNNVLDIVKVQHQFCKKPFTLHIFIHLLVWFLSSFHYYCHCYHFHALNALFWGWGASTRVSWQSQQYFEETIPVRHPPKAIHPKNHQNKPSFSAWPHREARESWRVFFANV